jgi:hypothetical protein
MHFKTAPLQLARTRREVPCLEHCCEHLVVT